MKEDTNLFLICGDEEYLKEQKKRELLDRYHCEGSMNFNVFSDDNIDMNEIAALAGTMPFMEDTRKLLISDSGLFKGNAGAELAEALKDIPDSTIVIFFEKEFDRSNALYKLFNANGMIFKFDTAESKSGKEKTAGKTDVRNWAKTRLREAGRKIDSRVLFDLVEMTGYDMQNLSTELEKLICYTMDEPDGYVITKKDVDSICSKTLSDKVFEMVDHKFAGRVSEALKILEDLYAMKTPPMRILYIMVKQYNQALSYLECREKRMSDAQIEGELGVKSWMVDKLKNQTSRINTEELKRRLELCADMEYKTKRGDIPEKLAVEIIIIR